MVKKFYNVVENDEDNMPIRVNVIEMEHQVINRFHFKCKSKFEIDQVLVELIGDNYKEHTPETFDVEVEYLNGNIVGCFLTEVKPFNKDFSRYEPTKDLSAE